MSLKDLQKGSKGERRHQSLNLSDKKGEREKYEIGGAGGGEVKEEDIIKGTGERRRP